MVGGEAPSLQHVSQCTRRECGDVRHSDFGHGDALDGEPLLRALLINVGDAPCASPVCLPMDHGDKRGLGSPEARAGARASACGSRLGLRPAAWLALDDRTLIVIGDLTAGDRARCGLACAAVLRGRPPF